MDNIAGTTHTAPASTGAEVATQSAHHRVAAIYPTQDEAEAVRRHLIAAGLAADTLDVMHADALPDASEDSDETLKLVLVDGAVGTAIGTGVGALGTLALWASGISLFVASPVIAPLAMLGWFAGLGAVVGGAVGATQEQSAAHKEGDGRFSELVMDAIKSGHAVLIARTRDETERQAAETIVRESLKGRDEDALKLT